MTRPQGRDLEARFDIETVEACYLPSGLAYPAFLRCSGSSVNGLIAQSE